jgi:hypothetical protein
MRALALLDATPTLTRRKMLSLLGAVTWSRPRRTSTPHIRIRRRCWR